jgi:hypothetical protein
MKHLSIFFSLFFAEESNLADARMLLLYLMRKDKDLSLDEGIVRGN